MPLHFQRNGYSISPPRYRPAWGRIFFAIIPICAIDGVEKLSNHHPAYQVNVVSADLLIVSHRLRCSDQSWQVSFHQRESYVHTIKDTFLAISFISNVFMACYVTGPTQHFCPHDLAAPFIASCCRPTLRATESDKADDSAVNFGFETFVDASDHKSVLNATSSKSH